MRKVFIDLDKQKMIHLAYIVMQIEKIQKHLSKAIYHSLKEN